VSAGTLGTSMVVLAIAMPARPKSDNTRRERILGFANAVFRDDEADREIDPVVGDPREHARLMRLEVHSIDL
jgi:hypothetical protein